MCNDKALYKSTLLYVTSLTYEIAVVLVYFATRKRRGQMYHVVTKVGGVPP